MIIRKKGRLLMAYVKEKEGMTKW